MEWHHFGPQTMCVPTSIHYSQETSGLVFFPLSPDRQTLSSSAASRCCCPRLPAGTPSPHLRCRP